MENINVNVHIPRSKGLLQTTNKTEKQMIDVYSFIHEQHFTLSDQSNDDSELNGSFDTFRFLRR
jgi:hypothetical protein